MRTTAGSLLYSEFVPREDAAVVQRLRRAGAVIMGKTNLVEFAYSPCDEYHDLFGPTRNPWDLRRFPGASSNGSAAATAAGIVPLAIGSDTGGSVRTPASFCGLTGLMPTAGLVSRYGQMTLAQSLDTVGLLARTADDCGLLLDALIGLDRRDTMSVRTPYEARSSTQLPRFEGLRFGVLRGFPFADLQTDVGRAVDSAIRALEDLGGRVEDVAVPGLEHDAHDAMLILAAEASASHRVAMQEHPDKILPAIRSKLEDGFKVTAVDYLGALEARARVRRALQDLLRQVDVLVTPTCDTTAPLMSAEGRILEPPPYLVNGRPSSRVIFNLARLPALSIPCGFDELNLPIGIQFAGPPFADRRLLAVARTFQKSTRWHNQHPPIADSTMPIEYP